VPKKKKIRRFSATTAVKSMARAALGAPPPVKRLENKKKKTGKEKHKATISKLTEEQG
jgi:hypothetical protein